MFLSLSSCLTPGVILTKKNLFKSIDSLYIISNYNIILLTKDSTFYISNPKLSSNNKIKGNNIKVIERKKVVFERDLMKMKIISKSKSDRIVEHYLDSTNNNCLRLSNKKIIKVSRSGDKLTNGNQTNIYEKGYALKIFLLVFLPIGGCAGGLISYSMVGY